MLPQRKQYQCSNFDEIYQEALKKAIESARVKAEAMAEAGDAPRRGWCPVGVSFALELAADGALLCPYDLREEQHSDKKTAVRPRRMVVPDHPPRSGKKPPAYFLCDTSTYFLGLAEDEEEAE